VAASTTQDWVSPLHDSVRGPAYYQ
jgi:hypothetical protein